MVLKNAFKLLANLKLFAVPILLFFWISSIFEHFMIQKIEELVNSNNPSTAALIGYGAAHLLSGILFPTLITLLALTRVRNLSLGPQTPEYQIDPRPSELLFIETLRSWGMTIWWFFALILPGIYKFIAYVYVPFVVFLDPAYERGDIDALKASEQQFRRRIWSTLSVFVVFYFVFPIMLSSFLDSYKNFNETPLLALLVSSLNGLLSLVALYIFAEMYTRDNPPVKAPVSTAVL